MGVLSLFHSFIHSLKISSSNHTLHQDLVLQEGRQHHKNPRTGRTHGLLNFFSSVFPTLDLLPMPECPSRRNTRWGTYVRTNSPKGAAAKRGLLAPILLYFCNLLKIREGV